MKRKLLKTETVIIRNSRYHYLIENNGEKTPLTSGEYNEILQYNRFNYLLNKLK